MDYTEKTLSCEEKYRGKIIYVHRDTVRLPDGAEAVREVVEHSGGVGVIPVDENGDVWCVRQFRYPFAAHLLEIPAGKLEPGEAPLECAVRELSEETGFTAAHYTDLGRLYPSPGYCRETLYIYMATGLTRGQAHLDKGEFLDVEKHSLDELYRMAMAGDLPDAKTAMAVIKAWLLQRGKD
ncbi:MAG: NUDIX hydrolase [Ruminococcaceae bacterium]|nr:NUDIX hydrolase [Oscillospiraceae bacterium]